MHVVDYFRVPVKVLYGHIRHMNAINLSCAFSIKTERLPSGFKHTKCMIVLIYYLGAHKIPSIYLLCHQVK